MLQARDGPNGARRLDPFCRLSCISRSSFLRNTAVQGASLYKETIQRGTHVVEILLVEDNPGDVQLFRSLLNGFHHITVAINGAEALDMLFQRGQFKDNQRPDESYSI